METLSFAAMTCLVCGPLRRRSASQAGGVDCNSFSSSLETTPAWNSAGVAERGTPSFLAAVAGFIVWMVFGLGEVMASRVVSRGGAAA